MLQASYSPPAAKNCTSLRKIALSKGHTFATACTPFGRPSKEEKRLSASFLFSTPSLLRSNNHRILHLPMRPNNITEATDEILFRIRTLEPLIVAETEESGRVTKALIQTIISWNEQNPDRTKTLYIWHHLNG